MIEERFFTSESVTEGHPDKICDLISDSVLDEILQKDKAARVACEVVCTTGLVMLIGEISTCCYVDIPKIVRTVLKKIGYEGSKFGFSGENCAVILNIDEQSSDIAQGVDGLNSEKKQALGAGDQGLVFGFACDETEEFLPAPIFYAHKLAKRLALVRKQGTVPYLGPDGKTQVTVKYCNGAPVGISAIVVSTQHCNGVSLSQIEADIKKHVIFDQIPEKLLSNETKIFINPTGRFVVGGPVADSGLTGRKIIVDSYGGFSRHGGGAFSGKDPTKVDRSAAYMARYVAKNIVAAGLAKFCEIQVAYAIGVSEPVSIFVDAFNSSKFSNQELEAAVKKLFNFSPSAIIERLDLLNVKFSSVACYGHFGRNDLNLPWERLNAVSELKKYFGA